MVNKLILWMITFLILGTNLFAEQLGAKFKVGMSAPLSGILAEYGQAIVNGIEMAKQDNPELFSKIEIYIEDSQYSPSIAVSNFNFLKDIKKVQLVYLWGSPTSEAVAPIAERAEFPLLAMTADYRVSQGRKYVIRVLRSGYELGALLTKYFKKQNYKKVGIVMAENSYLRSLYEGISEELHNSGIDLDLIETVTPTEQDFRSLITRLKFKKYDSLGVFLITGQVRTFYQQMNILGLKLPTFGSDFFSSKTEIVAAGSGIEGAIFPDLSVSSSFRERYANKYGNDIQISFAANAYDVAMQAATIFSEQGSDQLNSQQVIEKLKSSKAIKGAHGNFVFENSPRFGAAFVSDILLKVIRNSQILTLE